MINIRFSNQYKVLHFTDEIGKYMIGGVASYMNELYSGHGTNTGFVHIYDPSYTDISPEKYPGDQDIAAIACNELHRISDLQFEVAVVHYLGFSFLLDDAILKGRPLVYVIHAVPTNEPFDPNSPFGDRWGVKEQFEKFCNFASVIVCVSQAEKRKLISIYPELEPKIAVVLNGIRFEMEALPLPKIKEDRRIFGFIGRLDYRKGLLDCVKAFKGINGELRIACDKEEPEYLHELLLYIDAAGIKDRIHFYGWCQGERKKSFLNSLDALIIPSLTEACAYVVLEAMKFGIPIICSNRGGIPEVTGNYRFLFNPCIEGSLEAAIKQYQAASIEEIESELSHLLMRKGLFTTEKMCKAYDHLFESMRPISKSNRKGIVIWQ